ncbi:MAG: hypothetical protein JOY59_03075, partial [Candidatus Eremiobacteraeota bacterium]|nr:hypothetical protein [Candidatus Eremiobacteraeota bacterium]
LGDIYGLPALREVWNSLCDEAVAVAAADGYDVRESLAATLTRLEGLAQTTPGFTSSMNRDVRAGRRSELEWLTGTLVRLAAENAVAVPAHAALYGILRYRSSHASISASVVSTDSRAT